MICGANGILLYYEKTGAGPPLLLLHGNGEDHTVFDAVLPGLARHFSVYAIDSRGHGQSTKTGEISYSLMMEDVADFIAVMRLEKPLLMGFSDGAVVGLLLAVAHPQMLRGLVACGANTNPGQLRPWFRAMARVGWWVTRDAKLRMMLKEPDITDGQLGQILIPVLVVAGSHDILPVGCTRGIARAIPRGRLRILPAESHASYLKKGELLCSVVTPFLRRA